MRAIEAARRRLWQVLLWPALALPLAAAAGGAAPADGPGADGAPAESAPAQSPAGFDFRSAKLRQALLDAERHSGADSLDAAKAAADLAGNFVARSQFAQAVPLYRRSLQIREQRLGSSHPLVGTTQILLANAFSGVGESEIALSLAQRGLAVYEDRYGREDARLVPVLYAIGSIARDGGKLGLALDYAQRGLDIALKTQGATSLQAGNGYNMVGMFYMATGRYAQAIEPLRRAIDVLSAARGPDSAAASQPLFNLGLLYNDLGQHDKALPNIERAVRNDRANIGEVNVRVANKLAALANTLCTLGRCREALPVALHSVEVAEQLDNPDNLKLSSTMVTLADVYHRLGRNAEALPLLERVLAIRERVQGADHPSVATILRLMATIERSQGHAGPARELLLRALPIAARGDQDDSLWKTQDGLRLVAAESGQRDEAIYWGKSAVNTIQGMRATLQNVDQELQHSFLQSRHAPYKGLASLLIDAGRLAEAEQVLALLKDHEVAQLIHRGEAVRPSADLVGAERAAQDDYQSLVAGALERAHELDALERRARYEALAAADEARRRQLQEEATEWRENFRKWVAALPARLAARAPASAETREIAGRSSALSTLVRADPQAVGLYYVVNDEDLAVIVATARGAFGRRLPVRALELNRAIERLRQALAEPASDPRPAAQALYRTLLEPISAELEKAQARTLVLSLTDNLRYIPFAALYDGQHYVVERYAVAQIVAGANQKADAARNPWQISAFGMTRAAAPLPALPGVRYELESIVRLPGTSTGVLPGTISLDQDFDRTRLEAALRGEHRVVHIGSHFVLAATGAEEDSYLLLGDGSRLSLDQIATLDFAGVDQLTLSACDTAKGGGIDQNGAEVEGMATIVARQGALSVLASLWPVNDQSTAQLMHAFYAGRTVGSGLTRAQALQQAQLALLHGTPIAAPGGAARTPAAGGAGAAPFAHPYYWAPFVIMGDWL